MSDTIELPVEAPLTSASKLLSGVLSQLDSSRAPTAEQLRQLQLVQTLLSGMDAYLDSVSSPAPAVQRPLLQATAEHDWQAAWDNKQTLFHLSAAWSAGAYEGNLVGMLTKLMRAKKVLEIGMFTAQRSAGGGQHAVQGHALDRGLGGRKDARDRKAECRGDQAVQPGGQGRQARRGRSAPRARRREPHHAH
ncbi:hypothetical protein L1887_57760 [Cichorium endivia]|nr:hypothetical protein L1887_57760 [Cichorium endivia]